MRFKKGQLGETMTWMVATIIIVVFTIFFIFGTNLIAKSKGAGFTIFTGDDSKSDVQQMMFAVLNKNVGGGKIIDFIQRGESIQSDLDSIMGEFEGEGISCDFSVEGLGSYDGDDNGREVTIEISGVEVSMIC